MVATNVVGVMNGIRAALPGMLERRVGHIVVIASVSGRVTYTGESAYVASKHATIAFADCLRQEVARAGIRVSVIEPGLVETPLIHVYPGALDMVPDVTPLAPDDIARARALRARTARQRQHRRARAATNEPGALSADRSRDHARRQYHHASPCTADRIQSRPDSRIRP